jgi:hypothetical protein
MADIFPSPDSVLLPTERFCDRREELCKTFLARKKQRPDTRAFSRHWKAIAGCLLGIILWASCHFSSPETKHNAFATGIRTTTSFLAAISTQVTFWLRQILTRSPEISSDQKAQEYLKHIKIQDIQTLGTTQAKIRIDNKVYLLGAVIHDDPSLHRHRTRADHIRRLRASTPLSPHQSNVEIKFFLPIFFLAHRFKVQ